MRPEDRETLLWKLSELPARAARDDALVADEELEAYRLGTLPEEAMRRVEELLTRHAANRRRLVELAGIADSPAPDQLRRQLVARFARRRSASARRWRWAGGLIAAAALLALFFAWPALRPSSSLPTYEVVLSGLSERRSGPQTTGSATAYAHTRVVVDATVTGKAARGVEVGLYGVRRGRLERLDERSQVRRQESPGAVRFVASAADLVGAQAGEHELYVVVARLGDLPAVIVLDSSHDAAALVSAGRRDVHRLTLRLLPGPAPASTDVGASRDEERRDVSQSLCFAGVHDHDSGRPVGSVLGRAGRCCQHLLAALSA